MYTLFYNAKIHTLAAVKPLCTALLTVNDRIVYSGKYGDINIPGYEIEKIDLKGKHIFPAFIDCHTHIATAALAKERLQFNTCNSMAQALAKIRRKIKNYPRDSWILGMGWNANIWNDGKPHKQYLDEISDEHAMAFYNKDGHTQWLNSQALHRCGFSDNSQDPAGGKLDRDERGLLTGLVYEKACELVDKTSDRVTYKQLKRGLDTTYHDLYRIGITSVHSCEGLDKFRLFQQLAQNQDLGLRICMHPPSAEIAKIIAAGVFSGYGNKWLRLGGMKYFVDGSLGSQTAEMFEPFDTLNHTGLEVINESDLTDQICFAADHGLSATVHAIGDRANHKALNVFQKVAELSGPLPLRQRIEHCQILQASDIPRFKKLAIIASMQPIHIADDIEIAEKYLGPRAALTYAIGTMMKSGCRVVFGSDMPVANPDPLKGILAAVSRRYQLDSKNRSWYPEQCITPLQALHAYTRDAAYASSEENLKGTLEPGKLADFVVLSHDITENDEAILRDARIESTILAGRVVYSNASS